MQNNNIVEFKNVSINYPLKKYTIKAVTDITIPIKRGKITALVGESGSGKTTLSSSIIRCISEPGVIAGGEITFRSKQEDGTIKEYQIEKMTERELEKFRWEKVSMVFQAAQSALNPVMTVKEQFIETMVEHDVKLTKQEMEEKCLKLLDFVKLDVQRVLNSYPHELSGGMKQRVMIAFSLLLDPELIILDEPTTALDVITQSYIFNLLKEINEKFGITMLLMTHDISVVAKFADYIGVMYGGRLMEYGTVFDIFKNKRHPYTEGLINATPSIIGNVEEMKPIEGNPPDLMNLPQGCIFNPRCSRFHKLKETGEPLCETAEPEMVVVNENCYGKCYYYKRGALDGNK